MTIVQILLGIIAFLLVAILTAIADVVTHVGRTEEKMNQWQAALGRQLCDFQDAVDNQLISVGCAIKRETK